MYEKIVVENLKHTYQFKDVVFDGSQVKNDVPDEDITHSDNHIICITIEKTACPFFIYALLNLQ